MRNRTARPPPPGPSCSSWIEGAGAPSPGDRRGFTGGGQRLRDRAGARPRAQIWIYLRSQAAAKKTPSEKPARKAAKKAPAKKAAAKRAVSKRAYASPHPEPAKPLLTPAANAEVGVKRVVKKTRDAPPF